MCEYCRDFDIDISEEDCEALDIIEADIPSFPKMYLEMCIVPEKYEKGKPADTNVLMFLHNDSCSEELSLYYKFNYCPMCGRKLSKDGSV